MAVWNTVSPAALTPAAARAFVEYARALRRGRDYVTPKVDPRSAPALTAAQFVMRDLVVRQRWRIRVRDGVVQVAKPHGDSNRVAEKDRLRAQLLVERDEQLRNESVRSFVKSMETRHMHKGRAVSIFSLMRDGSELAAALEKAARLQGDAARERAMDAAVQPYLQVVSEKECCEWTGLRLLDIWRYFRHTWSSPYRSVPGRTMMVLVRDAAIEPHPVIGIAALSSAAMQISVRDKWIGWTADALIASMTNDPTLEAVEWLQRTVREALREIYVADFLEDGFCTAADLKNPSRELIARFLVEERDQRAKHERFMPSAEYKRRLDEEDWEVRARTHLYRSRRAELLATLLRASSALRRTGKLTAKSLKTLLETDIGRRAVRSIIIRAKAERVGTAMADITVCGAVAPYNAILGGKLVGLLLGSPEIVAAYRTRYQNNCSIIASSIAGRPVVKPSELVLLCTTSLYGVGSSQYNRLRLPCEVAGGAPGTEIRFLELGKTAGYGTIHFGTETIEALATLAAQKERGQRINSVFGEGISPRLRKVRDGLDHLEFPSDALLKHGSPRVVYGIALARNFREVLLGHARIPEYVLPMSDPHETTRRIAAWWSRRWLLPRASQPDVLNAIRSHRLVHPIKHGARVTLPKIETEQLSLMDD